MDNLQKRHILWLGVSLVGALLLAACSSGLNTETAAEPAETREPEPAATATTTGQEPEPTATATTPEAGSAATGPRATPAPTDLVPADGAGGEGVLVGDDRPRRLQTATQGWGTNWSKHTIDYNELLPGGPPRDGIPSIDDPNFVSPEEAAPWLADNEPVVALELNGDARAYPLQILTWHEIVNDTVGNTPVMVTFCPLCNSAITFDRTVDGEVFEFGTSGLLRNSDLVMYDRTTESLWQQFTGEAIVGDMTGQTLDFVPSSIVSFAHFSEAYPQGLVLSRDTGHRRDYGRNPYAGYDRIGQSPFLFDGEPDERLAAMARVVTVSSTGDGGQPIDIAYPLSVLADLYAINDAQVGRNLVVFYAPGTSSALDTAIIAEGADVGATGVFDAELDGQILTFERHGEQIIDRETGSTWNVLGQATEGPLAGEQLAPIVHGDQFWFAWAAFKPDTIIYRPEE